jgi:NitT/TauT family transport system substrate-binding protein
MMKGSRRAPLLMTVSLVLAIVAACAPAPATTPAKSSEPPPAAMTAARAAAPPTSAPAAAAPTSTAAPAAVAPLSPPVDLKLAIFGSLSDSGFYIAKEKGYFEAEGLNVETIPSGPAPQTLPLLSSGQIDVAGTSQSPALFNAVARGVPVTIVADKGRSSPGHAFGALMIRKDLIDSGRVRDYPDLRGLRIATPARGTSFWGVLARALEKGGLTFTDIEAEELTQPDSLPALANGAVDGAMLLEPFLAAATARGIAIPWKTVPEFAPNEQDGLVAYSPQFIERQPEAARHFAVAYLRGVRDYIEAFDNGRGKEEVTEILIKSTPIKDRALYDTMGSVGFEPNGRVNIDYLRSEGDLYVREGLLTYPVDAATFVDHQYVDYAVGRLGRR